MRNTVPVEIRRRRELWRGGEVAEHLYFVRSGIVSVASGGDEGRGSLLGFHGKGEVVGEGGAVGAALGHPIPRHTRGVAHEELLAYAMPISELRVLMERSPVVAAELAGLMADRRRRAELRLIHLPFRPVADRLAVALIELARGFGVRDSRGIIINLRLTHRELGALVGSTRETVSGVLADLKRQGVLLIEGKRVIVLDVDALSATADDADFQPVRPGGGGL